MNLAPVTAPPGYLWSWRGKGKAHLITSKNSTHGLRMTVCGRQIRADQGRTGALQVGGYSQTPCPNCLEWTP